MARGLGINRQGFANSSLDKIVSLLLGIMLFIKIYTFNYFINTADLIKHKVA